MKHRDKFSAVKLKEYDPDTSRIRLPSDFQEKLDDKIVVSYIGGMVRLHTDESLDGKLTEMKSRGRISIPDYYRNKIGDVNMIAIVDKENVDGVEIMGVNSVRIKNGDVLEI